jgi:hypothetical protein
MWKRLDYQKNKANSVKKNRQYHDPEKWEAKKAARARARYEQTGEENVMK